MWRRFREFLARIKRMKPERIQKKHLPPFDVPLTVERIQDRSAGLDKGWRLVMAPVALQFRQRFPTFQEAAAFVSRDVAGIAAFLGEAPSVEIEGSEVFLTLGVETPQILSEGDFDFAEALAELRASQADGGKGDGAQAGGKTRYGGSA